MNNIQFKYHLENIDSVAKQILEHLDSKVLLFNGTMGSGKTTLINAMLKAMNSSDVATSPTFSIVNEYQLPDDKVYHFDFYRVESIEEAYNFGIEDYLTSNHWIFIEWPERISEILPKESQTITITELEDSQRSLKLTINKRSLTENNAMTVPKF